jgi:hypothetical protein
MQKKGHHSIPAGNNPFSDIYKFIFIHVDYFEGKKGCYSSIASINLFYDFDEPNIKRTNSMKARNTLFIFVFYFFLNSCKIKVKKKASIAYQQLITFFTGPFFENLATKDTKLITTSSHIHLQKKTKTTFEQTPLKLVAV